MSAVATKATPLVCPSCGGRLDPDDVNVELMLALCRSCSSTVELAHGAPADPDVRESPPAELLELTQPPAGIQVETRGDTLVLTRRWFQFNAGFLFLLLWCTVWDGFLVVWYAVGLGSLAAGEGEAVMMLLFPMLHVAAGVAVTYLLAATMVNRSVITVTPAHIEVTHGPLPWAAPAPIPTGSVDQFYLTQVRNKNTRTYNLVARRTDLTSEQLLKGLHEDTQARYLERRLEAHLRIADRAVDGEYTG